tara:strand:- start:2353 stop:2559 length:207 start_codon:yes stop_codon:yes gene_type:complete
MKLSNQAVGALMMALQKSLMEQSDVVPTLLEMDFVTTNAGDLQVTNPPVVSLEGVELATEEDNEILVP